MVALDVTPAAQWLAVATVSYGSDAVVAEFLKSIPAATSVPVAIVVSDNLPHADSEIRRLAQQSGATYLPMGSNIGYGAAMNAAVAALPPNVRWILISNPDVIFSPGAIDNLVAVGELDPHVGAVGPAILNSDGTIYPSARAVPSLRTGLGHAMFSNLWPQNPWSRRYRNNSVAAGEQRDTGWLSGSCLLVRRAVFEELGGFDPEYFMYFEDVDFGYRLGKLGYRNVYAPSATATHSGAHSTSGDSVKMIAIHHTSARRFLSKKYSGALLWPLRVALNAGLTVRSAIIGRRIRRQERKA